jgi:hypothetical protein
MRASRSNVVAAMGGHHAVEGLTSRHDVSSTTHGHHEVISEHGDSER